jgi:nucleotide-binding universal stress UspA family protein
VKILIGIDDSATSKRALDYVSRIRWPAGSTVLVATVLRPVFGTSPDDPERVKFSTDLVERAGQRPREAGLATATRLLEGEPGDALVAAAKSERCDLIVVGSHGRSGLAKLLLGSVASHVVTHAPCSVLVVKGEQRLNQGR